jgi:hypothetical protein
VASRPSRAKSPSRPSTSASGSVCARSPTDVAPSPPFLPLRLLARGVRLFVDSLCALVCVLRVASLHRHAPCPQVLQGVQSVLETAHNAVAPSSSSSGAGAAEWSQSDAEFFRSSSSRGYEGTQRHRGSGRQPAPPPRRQQQQQQAPQRKSAVSRLAGQPATLTEGLTHAYQALSRSFRAAYHNVVVLPADEFERSRGDTKRALRCVLRGVPTAVLKPLIGTAEAISKTVRSSCTPHTKLCARV